MSVPTLYKYKSLSTTEELKHARSLVRDSEIYLSSSFDFNDPFDCRPVFRLGATEEDRRRYFREFLKIEITPEVIAKVNWPQEETRSRDYILKASEDNRVGLCCFSEVGDEILMYSHYASAHQGFCFEFEMPIGNSFGEARRVEYSNEYPMVDPFSFSVEKNMESMYLSKSTKWEHEKEWRIFAFHAANTVRKFPEGLLKGVIFGCRMDEDYKVLFREWASKRSSSLQFYEARIKEKEYGFDIVPVD